MNTSLDCKHIDITLSTLLRFRKNLAAYFYFYISLIDAAVYFTDEEKSQLDEDADYELLTEIDKALNETLLPAVAAMKTVNAGTDAIYSELRTPDSIRSETQARTILDTISQAIGAYEHLKGEVEDYLWLKGYRASLKLYYSKWENPDDPDSKSPEKIAVQKGIQKDHSKALELMDTAGHTSDWRFIANSEILKVNQHKMDEYKAFLSRLDDSIEAYELKAHEAVAKAFGNIASPPSVSAERSDTKSCERGRSVQGSPTVSKRFSWNIHDFNSSSGRSGCICTICTLLLSLLAVYFAWQAVSGKHITDDKPLAKSIVYPLSTEVVQNGLLKQVEHEIQSGQSKNLKDFDVIGARVQPASDQVSKNGISFVGIVSFRNKKLSKTFQWYYYYEDENKSWRGITYPKGNLESLAKDVDKLVTATDR